MLEKGSAEDLRRLWGDCRLRVFISHKDIDKKTAMDLKESLRRHEIACFVAHEDIEPTKEWRKEIERALASMQVLVPLLTEDFRRSDWTDQEVGVAIGRGDVVIVPIRIDADPYGFIGNIQALSWSRKNVDEIAQELVDLLRKHDKLGKLPNARDIPESHMRGYVGLQKSKWPSLDSNFPHGA